MSPNRASELPLGKDLASLGRNAAHDLRGRDVIRATQALEKALLNAREFGGAKGLQVLHTLKACFPF